ncbi:hypothetical protein GIB67_024696, partial [Kingdonia uniflora]
MCVTCDIERKYSCVSMQGDFIPYTHLSLSQAARPTGPARAQTWTWDWVIGSS